MSSYEPLLNATDKGLDQLDVVSFQAVESLSSPYRIVVDVRTLDPTDPDTYDPGTWLRKKLSVGVARNADPTWFHGIVTAVEHLGDDDRQYQLYRLELAPSFALLKHTRRTRVFTDQKPLDVVKSVLGEGGVTIEMKASGAGGVMRHITQFEESDFAFVSRLLEQEGACYWFTHTKTAHTMVIGDAATHHPGSGSAIHATYAPAASEVKGVGSEGVVTALSRRHEVVSKETVLRDYSEGHPKEAAVGQKSVLADKTPGAGGKHHEADYHVTQSDADATAYAGRLAEAMTSRSCRLVGSASVVAFRAGARIAVHGKDGYDEHIILSQVTHTLAQRNYSNTFEGVPVGRLPWRPLRSTPVPRIDGFIPAIVTAAAGAQGAGEDGSYKVRILNSDDQHDRVVRLAQPYAGTDRGMHFPLPVSTEVVLAHEYGHPDRPIIAGALHNKEDHSPVTESNKDQCVVKSACGAVLVFEDKKDEEKVTLQSKTEHKLEFDDKAKKVTLQSQKANKVEFDDDKEKMTIHAVKDHEVKVDGKSDTAVTGKKTIDCKDEIEITAAKKITFKTGAAKIIMESSGKITIEGTEIELTAKAKLSGSGATVAIEAQGTLDAKANGPLTVQSSAITTVKGSMVMIN